MTNHVANIHNKLHLHTRNAKCLKLKPIVSVVILKYNWICMHGITQHKTSITTTKVDRDHWFLSYSTFQIIAGNKDNASVQRKDLEQELIIRFVRFCPVDWYCWPCMRVELYGAPLNIGGKSKRHAFDFPVSSLRVKVQGSQFHLKGEGLDEFLK